MFDNRRVIATREIGALSEMAVTTSPLAIGDVLLLEDDALISLDTEDMLLALGAARVHVAHSLYEAEFIVSQRKLDAAVLDLVIGPERSEALARRLVARSTPVIFASGHDDAGEITAGLEGVPTVRKPYSEQALLAALATALSGRR